MEEPLFVADWRHFVRVFSTQRSAGLGQSPFNTGTLRSGGSRRDRIQVRLQTHEEDTGYPLPQGRITHFLIFKYLLVVGNQVLNTSRYFLLRNLKDSDKQILALCGRW